MLRRTAFATLTTLALASASFAANADILFSNLGTAAPPASIGGHALIPFDQAAQAAVPDGTFGLTVIPGSPVDGDLGVNPTADKRTAPGGGWSSSWSHGYTGPVFRVETTTGATLTLPPNTRAFYFYVESPFYSEAVEFTVTSNSGTSSGPIAITTGETGANGFAFYSTQGEIITSITINNSRNDRFALAEFGIATEAPTTCTSEGYTGLKLTWCKNICESDLSGGALDGWIRRWVQRYHTLPYCAIEEAQQQM
jgi:hypothetical protein